MRRIPAYSFVLFFVVATAATPLQARQTDRPQPHQPRVTAAGPNHAARQPPLRRVLRFVVKALSNDPIMPRP